MKIPYTLSKSLVIAKIRIAVSTSRELTGVRTWGRNDQGYFNNDILPINLRVYGSNTLPTSFSDGDVIATILGGQIDTTNANPQVLLSGFTTGTAYRYHWVGMDSVISGEWSMAEVEFYEDGFRIEFVSHNSSATTAPTSLINFNANARGNTVIADFSGSNELAVVWEGLGVDASGYGIQYQRFNSNGNPIAVPILVNTAVMNDQRFPTVATYPDPDRRSFIAWEGEDGSGRGISGQFFDASDNPIGNEFSVNPEPNGNQQRPDTVRLSNDNVVVAWSGEGVEDDEGVYARIIETQLIATGLNQMLTYQENIPVDFAAITITPPTFANNAVRVTLTLSNINAGTINTGTAGSVTSTFNTGTGIWQAMGPVNDVNALLSTLQFRSNFGFDSDFTIAVNVQDGEAIAKLKISMNFLCKVANF